MFRFPGRGVCVNPILYTLHVTITALWGWEKAYITGAWVDVPMSQQQAGSRSFLSYFYLFVIFFLFLALSAPVLNSRVNSLPFFAFSVMQVWSVSLPFIPALRCTCFQLDPRHAASNTATATHPDSAWFFMDPFACAWIYFVSLLNRNFTLEWLQWLVLVLCFVACWSFGWTVGASFLGIYRNIFNTSSWPKYLESETGNLRT